MIKRKEIIEDIQKPTRAIPRRKKEVFLKTEGRSRCVRKRRAGGSIFPRLGRDIIADIKHKNYILVP